jgi:uncharacterized membrane protein YozB (DUF420 family)
MTNDVISGLTHRRAMGLEHRAFWPVIGVLCAIAVAASVRRLLALAQPTDAATSSLDALFAAKAGLTRIHVMAGLAFALVVPMQLSSRIRGRWPALHRWLGRVFLIVGVIVGLSGYAMTVVPVGGVLEVSAIVVYATAFLTSLMMAWWHIRRRDVTRHREWMLRAIAIVLGIATTRPVVGVFFATSAFTGLNPGDFFGTAFWIGFTSTALAGEWYVRTTRPRK